MASIRHFREWHNLLGLTGLVLGGTILMAPRSAEAACGVLVADEGNNEIYVGVTGMTVPLTCPFRPLRGYLVAQTPTPRAAACWKDRNGNWRYQEFPGCTTSTDQFNQLMILAGDGDDFVAPVTHTFYNNEFVCPVPGSSGNVYGSGSLGPSPTLLEWHLRPTGNTLRPSSGCRDQAGCSVFPMGIAIVGGEGDDELHGTPTRDQIYSGRFYGPEYCDAHGGRGSSNSEVDACVCAIDSTCCTNWTASCADLAETSCGYDCTGPFGYLDPDLGMDLACGHNGTDALYGDHDNNFDAHERFSGGPGTQDYCQGTNEDTPPPCCSVGEVGCSADRTIESAVCARDPYCCNTQWDQQCIEEVTSIAGRSCSVTTAQDRNTTSCEYSHDSREYNSTMYICGTFGVPPRIRWCTDTNPAYTACADADPLSLPPSRPPMPEGTHPYTSNYIFSDDPMLFQEACRFEIPGGLPGGFG